MRKSGLKKALVLGLTVAMALGTMVTGNAAAKTWKYSFNTDLGADAQAAGWVNAYSQVYDASAGYGFDAANGWSAGIITKTASTSEALAGKEIGLDCADAVMVDVVTRAVSEVKGDTEVKFYVDLPAGTYDVTVYAGAISQNNTYDFNKIYINGEQIVRDFEKDPWNADAKSSKATLLTLDNIKWTKTITLTEKTKVEIKASNPAVENATWFGETKASSGGRAYMNAVEIKEVTASTDKVPKTGVVSTAAICGLVALAGAGVAVVSRKKED